MVLPFHSQTLLSFKNETLVESALMASLDKGQGGIYLLPKPHSKESEQSNARPFAFVAMSPNGWGSMGTQMAVSFLLQVLGAALVTGLLLKTAGMSYWGRVLFVVIFALAVGVIAELPQWNWWRFSLAFVGAEIFDLVIGWFLAGLVIAKVTK